MVKDILHPGPEQQWKPSPAVSYFANRFGFQCKKGREDWFVCRGLSHRAGKNCGQKPAGSFPGRVSPEAQIFFPPLIQLRALPAGAGVKDTAHISV